MSGHLIGCAGALKHLPIDEHLPEDDRRLIPTSHKLALLAFADSADDRTHIGFAGYDGVQRWAVCSRGRAAELIRDLVAWGLLEQHKRGHRGQRAEYVVFPHGCCDLHRPETEDETDVDVDVEQLAAAAGVSVDQARQLLAAMAAGGVDVQPAGTGPATPEKGSGAPDATSGNASDTPDPIRPGVHDDAAEPVDNPGKGPERVHESRSTADAFTPSKDSPYPAGEPAGRCPAHPNGHANCRSCGTSPRARRTSQKRAAAAAARAAEQQRRSRERTTTAAQRLTTPLDQTPAYADLKAEIAAAERARQEKTR